MGGVSGTWGRVPSGVRPFVCLAGFAGLVGAVSGLAGGFMASVRVARVRATIAKYGGPHFEYVWGPVPSFGDRWFARVLYLIEVRPGIRPEAAIAAGCGWRVWRLGDSAVRNWQAWAMWRGGATYEAVSNDVGLSRERARQIILGCERFIVTLRVMRPELFGL